MTIVHPYDHAWRYNCVHPEDVEEYLAGPEGATVRLNVKRGAGWLADRDPAWADKIVEAVEAEEPETDGLLPDHFGLPAEVLVVVAEDRPDGAAVARPHVCHGIYHHGCPSCDRQDPEDRE